MYLCGSLSSRLHYISSTIPHVHVLSIEMHKYTCSKETQLAGLHEQSQSKSRVQGSNLRYQHIYVHITTMFIIIHLLHVFAGGQLTERDGQLDGKFDVPDRKAQV